MVVESAEAHRGVDILNDPMRNKGTAFTQAERELLHIQGLIPPAVETIKEQLVRTAFEFERAEGPLAKHIYLRALQDNNEVLFLQFVKQNLEATLPIVYTPTVGLAAQEFSRIYRRPRGLFLSYATRDRLRRQLGSITREIDVIVATDGQRILGLGDQGIGGMGIPIGKLSLYSAFGGIDPDRTLPIMIDVGTNNEDRLADQCYLGERFERIDQAEYDSFIDQIVDEVHRRWPGVLLQWEDFAQQNATPILKRHRDRILSFNDDIQGTAAVALAVVMAAVRQLDQPFTDQRICILGAGSAGSGVGTMIARALENHGVANAREQMVLVDVHGVVHDQRDDLREFQVPLAFSNEVAATWDSGGDENTFETVVRHFKPTVLFGVSGVGGLFTERSIKTMAEHCENPIILPLSNPTSHAEATPHDLLTWTEGNAIVATGSPFDPVTLNGITHTISQSNNVYVFPGVGLGVVACHARKITDEMLMAAAEAVGDPSGSTERGARVLPPLEEVTDVSERIARAVARVACEQGVADELTDAEIDERIASVRWEPNYRDFTRSDS